MVAQPIRILLQTTIPETEDDWSIARFSLLHQYLVALTDAAGNPLCQVSARDRVATGDDPVLSGLDRSQFDELWLFALDLGEGLTAHDIAGIDRFHRQGGGVFTTRDHMDMGLSMKPCETLGAFHYFHTANPDPDESRCCVDDTYTSYISWPNYHSGRNGDYQKIQPVEPLHELLRSPTGRIELFPAHPHEGGVGVPAGTSHTRVIATGKSLVTERDFNLVVVGDRLKLPSGEILGRTVAQSTFHHFADYNWDIDQGCPSFVDEAPGDGMKVEPRALADIQAYVQNLVLWLAPA